ncbi:ImmA/IrrE family metallo-endopeptidase [Levilactobacillus angrenensis]|uniref:ImmA/IrrE family metallo-endopeptidase n=1 Tax=Levilactobacillus angrenensis TaxID=2486020 RepID=A0ABW1UBT3_9LACO|nr:ImmA/IrrE family metallo-endopeptidase [Levilactobacillus angrenensis]
METLRVPVSAKVIQWAIAHGEKSADELRRKFQLAAWLHPRTATDLPTFQQIQSFSHETRVPFDYFFRDRVPEEEYAFTALRTINAPAEQPSRRLVETVYTMETRQAWMTDYLLEQDDHSQFQYLRVIDEGMCPATAAKKVADLLALSGLVEMNDADFLTALRASVSKLGILVIQNGVVGTDSQRPLPVAEFRAMALSDEVSPLIFINDTDNEQAKVFSLLHELIHVLLGYSEILNASLVDDVVSERWVNQVTMNVLLPETAVCAALANGRSVVDGLKFLSRKYHVSLMTAATRLQSLGAADHPLVNWVRTEQQRLDMVERADSGRNRREVDCSRIDLRFAKAVIDREASGELPIASAAAMLDVPLRTYDGVVDALMG